MPQNQQLDVLGELAAAAAHEQPQQRREPEIREGKKHPPMLPDPAPADIRNRNLVLKPLRPPGTSSATQTVAVGIYVALGDSISIDDYTGVCGGGAAS